MGAADFNDDGLVNILDIVLLVNFILGEEISGIQYYLSDLNSDSTINIQDIILLINIILSS